MKVTGEEQSYTQEIFRRCSYLIETNIWSGIEPGTLRRWFYHNFNTKEERYFAARMLDVLIYRSKQQTFALLKQLFQRIIPDFFREKAIIDRQNQDLLAELRKHLYLEDSDSRIRIVAVEPPNDGPLGSTYFINTYARDYLKINPQWIIRPSSVREEVAKGANVFIFLDDFLGSGVKFLEMWQHASYGLIGCLNDLTVIYAPLVSHEEGIRYLESFSSIVNCCPVERLDSSHSIFNPSFSYFRDDTNTEADFRDFYSNLIKEKGLLIPPHLLWGNEKLELAFAFENSIPNSSIPLLWWDESPSWTPLFRKQVSI